MKSELTKLSEIKSNPSNPRIIKDEKFRKLVASIKEFPQMLELRPIVVNDDMIVLGGNMRLKACKEAGIKEVPVIKASNLTEEQQRQFVIKDNLGSGEWDWDSLANEWDDLSLKDWGLIQWDVPEYNPIVNPTTNYDVVTDEKVEEINNALNSKMQDINTQDNLIEVICPKCAEEFFIIKTHE
jgi:ParB-like chromosome segregation protein Spo0J